jgi:heat shock protein HslJ
MNRITRLSTLVLFALITMLSACNDGLHSFVDSELSGSRWRLNGWSVSSLNPSDFTITATFTDREISGTSAVNQYGGIYLAERGDFSTRDVFTTEIAGPEQAMRAEQMYMQLLRNARKYRRTADRLALMDANGNDLLYFVPVK